jgi:integrase
MPRQHRWVFTAGPSREYPYGGHRISASHTLDRLKSVLKRLGLTGHLHTFRHFFVSYCANRGVPPFQLMKWVGHSDVATVTRYYTLQDEESVNMMRRLSSFDRTGSGLAQGELTG